MKELYPIITSFPPKYSPIVCSIQNIGCNRNPQLPACSLSIEPTAMHQITVACIIILRIKLSLYFSVEIDKYYQVLSNAMKTEVK